MITIEAPEKFVAYVRRWFGQEIARKKLDRKFIKSQLKLARKNPNIPFVILHLGFLIQYSRSKQSSGEIYEVICSKFAMCGLKLTQIKGRKVLEKDSDQWNEQFLWFLFHLNKSTTNNQIIESACLAQLYVLDAHSKTFEHQNLEAIAYLDTLGLGVFFRETCRGLYGEIIIGTVSQSAA